MAGFDSRELITALLRQERVFLCGPDFGSAARRASHLRVYVNGGILCTIPTSPRAHLNLRFFRSGYLRYVPEEVRRELEAAWCAAQGSDAAMAALLMDPVWLPVMIAAMERRFSGKERLVQTAIARSHRDFLAHGGTVVCDFETAIPADWYRRGPAALQTGREDGSGKRPKCDLAAFSRTPDGEGFLLSLVELKCTRSACVDRPDPKTGHSSGLTAHAKEMSLCMSGALREDCSRELLRRLGYMLRFGLLENAGDLAAELDALTADPQALRERVELRACFLFTGDGDIASRQDAAALCRSAPYLGGHLEDFRYQFRTTPAQVDLSDMEPWGEFSAGPGQT